MVKVRLPVPLRKFSNGATEVPVSGYTIGEVLQNLSRQCEGIGEHLFDPQGNLRRFINVFVNENDIRHGQGLKTEVKENDVVSIFPAIAGGVAPEISCQEAKEKKEKDAKVVVIDVREPSEWQQGHLLYAIHIPLDVVQTKIREVVPDRSTPIVCHCARGGRSLKAAEALLKMGYQNVWSMKGGFKAWQEAGFPCEVSSQLSEAQRRRYNRHLAIPEVGEEGQQKLIRAKVLLVGAGGLGCPAGFYLAAAGIGTIGIVDFDVVDETNLQRQILHTTDRLGRPKVDSASAAIAALNPLVKVNTYPVKLTSQNVVTVFKDYDVIVDGSDNFPTRYLVNDACVALNKPNVHGSVYRFEGQVTVFWPGRGPCYRCLYPEPPPPELAPSCAEAGVLGVLPGVIGLLEAVETIKIILEKGETLVGRLICYDALGATFRELKLRRDPHCTYCAEGKTFPGFIDYEQFCNAQS